MIDIVERLRATAVRGDLVQSVRMDAIEAADEIERLRAALEPSVEAFSVGATLGRTMREAAKEIAKLTALHETAAVRASVAQIEVEQLQEENMFLRSLVADRLRALNPAKKKRV